MKKLNPFQKTFWKKCEGLKRLEKPDVVEFKIRLHIARQSVCHASEMLLVCFWRVAFTLTFIVSFLREECQRFYM